MKGYMWPENKVKSIKH